MTDLVDRLRHADAHSVQRTMGGNLFAEAASEITRLRGEVASMLDYEATTVQLASRLQDRAEAAEARIKELEAALDAAPTDNELLPMARKIGETAGIPNHVERARQCWPTVVAALRSRTEGEG
jgi:hypothetical protein